LYEIEAACDVLLGVRYGLFRITIADSDPYDIAVIVECTERRFVSGFDMRDDDEASLPTARIGHVPSVLDRTP
jgi:hypothetical protein